MIIIIVVVVVVVVKCLLERFTSTAQFDAIL